MCWLRVVEMPVIDDVSTRSENRLPDNFNPTLLKLGDSTGIGLIPVIQFLRMHRTKIACEEINMGPLVGMQLMWWVIWCQCLGMAF
jgi:hypothetical protein